MNYFDFPQQFVKDEIIMKDFAEAIEAGYRVIDPVDDELDKKCIIPFKGLTKADKAEKAENGLIYEALVIATDADEDIVYRAMYEAVFGVDIDTVPAEMKKHIEEVKSLEMEKSF